MRIETLSTIAAALSCSLAPLSVSLGAAESPAREAAPLHLVPNFHDACMGWLVPYREERSFGLYSYLAHLDRVAADRQYRFAMSEIPHLVAMLEFEPKRFEELKGRIREGRVELVNAFVLEPTVSLSGGEALVQQGVQGLRWYRQVLGLRPRYAWMIDLVGWHEQMAQIAKGLGLDAMVYCRYNPTGGEPRGEPKLTNWDEVKSGAALHWIRSPEGSQVLALSPGLYCDVEFQPMFKSPGPLTGDELRGLIRAAEANRQRFPPGSPILVLGGEWDYSLPFRCPSYPSALIAAWNAASPGLPLRVSTLSEFVDAVLPAIRSGATPLPAASRSSRFGWPAFWVNMPEVKRRYRRVEHELQAAEMLSAAGSLAGTAAYPAQDFSNSWFLMCLNMDRNVLWGAGVDGSFSDRQSWDTSDRFEQAEAKAREASLQAALGLTRPDPGSLAIFNPVNWVRRHPIELILPEGRMLEGIPCQVLEDGRTVIARMSVPPIGISSARLSPCGRESPTRTDLPKVIGTAHYDAVIDPATGSLVSLRLKPSGRECLTGPANVVVVEEKSDVHNLPEKSKRTSVASSSQFKPWIAVTAGPLATIVEVRSAFCGGGELRRTIRFYQDSPRIDFVTETNGLPAGSILSVEFPLARPISDFRRGIPYGFSHGSRARKDPAVTGITEGILPAVRWTDYAFEGGGGIALLDRGIPGRELAGDTAILLLNNVCDAYALSWNIDGKPFSRPSAWLSDAGKQTHRYALLPHAQDWDAAAVARAAWEYNSPLLAFAGRSVDRPRAFVDTSENLIVEALRREGDEIELRMVECLGRRAPASIRVDLPHRAAARTDLLGERREALVGPEYKLDVLPQQIITLRLRTEKAPPPVEALRSFEPLIPPEKREAMSHVNPKSVGHPP